MTSRVRSVSRRVGGLPVRRVQGDTTSFQDDLGLIYYGGSPGSLTHLDNYGMIDMGSGESTFIPKAGKCIRYAMCLTAINTLNLGVTAATARANGWLVHGPTSNELTYGNPVAPIADIGNSGYQAACLQSARDHLSANPGTDGVFYDNFGAKFQSYNNIPFPIYDQNDVVLWSNQAAFQDAQVSFAANVMAALKADGYLIVPNGKAGFNGGDDKGHIGAHPSNSSADNTKDWLDLWHTYVTGITIESWLQLQPSPYTVGLNTQVTFLDYWDSWTAFIDYVQGYSLAFFPVDVVSSANAAVARYLRASFLMNWNGGSGSILFGKDGSYAVDPWTTELSYDVGQPRSARVAVGAGWKRPYERYTVYINPTATTQTLDGNSIASGDALFF